ncbi:hypothetical protein [Gluconacetobacter asukensis]|uniref:Mannosyltransferase (PIG-V) n=1 Tax=Gluconacetobacter asukensis TaxID=1017181 RepID=A0A7W4P277_9PROT|nr:hypothetical protein [Gluconacetobacter asukensis]MBB2171465.1 hypothetical protein [Gluconacetobacter asukensis]
MILFCFGSHAGILLYYIVVAKAFSGFSYSACQWDCGWYISIASAGYDLRPHLGGADNGQANWAFFPLFPLLLRAIHAVTGFSYQLSGVLLNNALFPVMAVSAALYLKARRPETNAYVTVLVFLASPFSLYFRVPFTESLYGTLLVALLFLLRSERVWLASVGAAFFTASRPTAAPLLAVMGGTRMMAQCLHARLAGGAAGRLMARSVTQCLALGLVGGIGLVAYMFYLHGLVGDALAFQHIEVAWGRHPGNPLANIWHGLQARDLSAASFLPGHEESQTYFALACVVAAGLVLWAFWSGLVLEAALVAVTLLLSTSTGLWSSTRYLYANPVTLMLVAALMQKMPRAACVLLFCLFSMVQALFVILWYQGARFLM